MVQQGMWTKPQPPMLAPDTRKNDDGMTPLWLPHGDDPVLNPTSSDCFPPTTARLSKVSQGQKKKTTTTTEKKTN